MKVVLDYLGRELTAEKGGDGRWLVSLSGRTAHARYLDYALAEVPGVPPGQAIPLATQVVQQLAPEPEPRDEAP